MELLTILEANAIQNKVVVQMLVISMEDFRCGMGQFDPYHSLFRFVPSWHEAVLLSSCEFFSLIYRIEIVKFVLR